MAEEAANKARGYKSTLSNPNTSEEAKQHAREVLDNELGGGGGGGQETKVSDDDGKDPANVARGYKSTLSNPNTSEEAKQRAREFLDNDQGGGGEGKDPGNVARGLKAAINNPNISEEGKKSAQEKLDDM